MARPQKIGVDYFPLDVNVDDTIKIIDAKFGVSGFGVLIKLWQIIYDNGYYIKWTEKELLLYKNRINADINLINDVIDECLKWGIFNAKLYEDYSILTSSGIQKRYFDITKRRSVVNITTEFLLTPLPNDYKPSINIVPIKVNVNNNSKNVNNNSKKDDNSTQSKVKESKVKNNINTLGEKSQKSSKFTPPTIEQVKQYCLERNNNVDCEMWHDFYTSKNWMIGKNKMKDWRAAVRTWERNRKDDRSSGKHTGEQEFKLSGFKTEK